MRIMVVCPNTGAEGLSEIEQNPPDAVLVCMDLLDMPGEDVIARIQAIRRLPIIGYWLPGQEEGAMSVMALTARGVPLIPGDEEGILAMVQLLLPYANSDVAARMNEFLA